MLSMEPLSVSSSPYALVFNLAGVSSWKLHMSVKFKFQLLVWWRKNKVSWDGHNILKHYKREIIWSEIYIFWVVSFQSFHLIRFGRFVLLFRVLVHAEIINDITTN